MNYWGNKFRGLRIENRIHHNIFYLQNSVSQVGQFSVFNENYNAAIINGRGIVTSSTILDEGIRKLFT